MVQESFPRPFADSYGVNLTIAILALVPFIVVTTASTLYRDQIASGLGATHTSLAIISGLAIAAYAFGAMLGGDFTHRFPQRPLFLSCEAGCLAGCLMAALAQGVFMYGAGLVLFGLATGMLLVAALPPVIQRFPSDRMPTTAVFVNLGFFGAVTIGPVLGGLVAYAEAWRWFYGGLAVICAGVLLVALFTLPQKEAIEPGMPFDRSAILLAGLATFLPFLGSGELTGHGLTSLLFAVPVGVGLICLIVLLLTQFHKREPLSPVKPMWHTYPIVGTLAAMFGGGAFVTFVELASRYQISVLGRSPIDTGFSFWPQAVGVLVTAALLGLLFRSRFLPILTLAGMLLIIAGGGVLLALPTDGSQAVLLIAIFLLGLGAGASVSPGLFIAGMSLPSSMIGRIFALVELVRSEVDFIMSPVLMQVAQVSSSGPGMSLDGVSRAIWITLLISAAITLFGVALYLLGAGPRLPQPDIEAWLEGDRPALASPVFGEVFEPRD